MAYLEIERTTPNDGNGDSPRVWSGKTNENMKELFSRNFRLGDYMVSRLDYDPLNLDFDKYKVEDRTWGYVDPAKEHFIEGFVKDASFVMPNDIYDETKFYIINEKFPVV